MAVALDPGQDLLPAFALAIDDVGLAHAAIERALIRKHQRGKAVSAQDLWAEAFAWVTTSRWSRKLPESIGPTAIASRDADPLARAVAELPVRQRSVIVCEQLLHWDDQQIADAHRAPISTIDLRRRRGLGELQKALGDDEPSFAALCPEVPPLPEVADIGRAARRRTFRTRSLTLIAGVSCIAVAGLAIQAAPDTSTEEIAVPGQVDPPNESRAPHAPIGDGRGGFAVYARSGGELSTSSDGELWTAQARLNVDRIDLRLFAEQFFRSSDKYVMLIDSTTGGGASRSASDTPRVAISDDLIDWTLLRLDVEVPAAGAGLRSEIDLLSAAVVDDTVLVAVQIDQTIDHRSLRLAPDDVCTTTDDREGLLLHLCDGTVVPVAEQGPAVAGTDRLLLSRAGNTFEELTVPPFFNPFGIVAYDGRFGMLEESSNQLYLSDDGRAWEPFFELGVGNRLGLIEAKGDELLTISPARSGWTSNLLSGETAIAGSLPLGIDPTTIWIKPQVASGPAGWAVYLTTSRPWDRRNDTVSGWAVLVDDWIIEQRPERSSVRLRSTTTNLLYEYHGLIDQDGLVLDHPSVRRSQFGGVRLFHPESGDLIVDVSGQRIRDAWVSGATAEPNLSGVRADPGQGEIDVDGWTISGNIRTGPIVLTGSDGTALVFDDGYALTNGDVADGIESTVAADPVDGTLAFFDDAGAPLLEVAAPRILDALDPVPDEDRDRARAMVLFSPDGIGWEQVWSTTRPTWYGSIAVGDDEILLSTAAFATGPERILVGQSDS